MSFSLSWSHCQTSKLDLSSTQAFANSVGCPQISQMRGRDFLQRWLKSISVKSDGLRWHVGVSQGCLRRRFGVSKRWVLRFTARLDWASYLSCSIQLSLISFLIGVVHGNGLFDIVFGLWLDFLKGGCLSDGFWWESTQISAEMLAMVWSM